MALNLLLGSAAAMLVAIQLSVGAAPQGLLAESLYNVAHLPWFALLTVVLVMLSRRLWPRHWLWVLLPVLALLVIVTELAQLRIDGRQVSLSDGFRNLFGAAAALVGYWCLKRRQPVALMLVIGVAVVATAWDPVAVWQAKRQRDALFPVLFSTAQPNALRLVGGNVTAQWSAFDQQPALSVPVTTVPWPGIRLRDLNHSWQSFDALVVEAVSLASQPMPLIAGTRHAGEPPSGATRSIRRWLAPGHQLLRYPRASLSPVKYGGVPVIEMMLYSEPEYADNRWLLLSARLE